MRGWDINKQNKTTKVVKHRALIFAFAIFGLFLLVGLILFGGWQFAQAYEEKILPRVYAGNIDLGGKTREQAKEILLAHIKSLNDFSPKIIYEEKTYTTKLFDLGIRFDLDKTIEEALNYGRQGSWIKKWKEKTALAIKPYNVSLSPQINEEKLDNYLEEISKAITNPPQDATLKINNGQIVLVSSKIGYGFDKKQFKDQLSNLIDQNQTDGSINIATTVLEPQIKEENTAEAKAAAENYLATPKIQLTFENQVFEINRAIIGSWLIFEAENGILKTHISNEAIYKYLNGLAKKIEISPEDREVENGSNKVLKEGRDGRGFDKTDLVGKIRNKLVNGNDGSTIAINTFTIQRGQKTIYPAFEVGKFTGRYIDVNLSQQMLRLIEGKNLIAEYKVSTGKWSMPTPEGVRYIENKSPKAWSAKYGLYMPFWNSIGGGYGIHELPEWPNGFKEGENHLGTPVSHGCIRLGVGPAETVYNWSPVGTPVYIHK